MSLDKQKILNELGNVMNQLQSANCGCMEKMFSNPTQCASDKQPMEYSFPSHESYHRGCCHGHRHNQTPFQMMPTTAPNNGHRNPPQLYSETYNYLNENLMKPVMKEVYDDLSSLNPSNAVANNPLAAQMGLINSQANKDGRPGLAGMTGQGRKVTGIEQNQMMNFPSNGRNPINPELTQVLGSMGPQIASIGPQIANMGPQIASMMLGKEKSKNTAQPSVSNSMCRQMGSSEEQAPYNISQMGNQICGIGNVNTMPQNNDIVSYQTNQEVNPPGSGFCKAFPDNRGILHSMHNPNQAQYLQSHVIPGDSIVKSPQVVPINNTLQPQSNQFYGQHAQGVQKFQEMFPNQLQSNLGYDPMAIAIQMNPQNNIPTIASKANPNTITADPRSNIPVSSLPKSHFGLNTNTLIPSNQELITQRQLYSNNNKDISFYKMPTVLSSLSEQIVPPKDTQALVDLKSASQMQQLPVSQLTPVAETSYSAINKNQELQQSLQNTEYNTLGQPVQNLPSRVYQSPVQNLPQTLSPQPSNNARLSPSKVKNTISKTSVIGMKSLGKTKSQLQHIYHQYKGQNYTSSSTGKLQESQEIFKTNPPCTLIENIGDSNSNTNDINANTNEIEKVKVNIGDTTSKPTDKLRNGLQDMVYSSRPISAAWTFHGQSTAPYPSIFQRHKSNGRTRNYTKTKY